MVSVSRRKWTTSARYRVILKLLLLAYLVGVCLRSRSRSSSAAGIFEKLPRALSLRVNITAPPSLIPLTEVCEPQANSTSTVSWPWGGGAPGGEVAEKKKEGEIAITSKRGNKIKKNAEPSNPAVHVKRSGNDVVKKASELNVEEKASGSGGSDNKKEDDSKKRKADEEADGKADGGDDKAEGGLEKNEEGKDVRKGGKKGTSSGAASGGAAAASKKQKKSPEKEEKPTEKKEEKKDEGEKKSRGRPKKDESEAKDGKASGAKKNKKEPAKPAEGDMVSTRTRSRGKA